MRPSVRAAGVIFEPRRKRELARRSVVGTRMTLHELFALPAEEPVVRRPPNTGWRTIAIVAGVAMLHVGVLFASAVTPRQESNEPHVVRTKVMQWHRADQPTDPSGEWADFRTDGTWRPAIVRMPARAFER